MLEQKGMNQRKLCIEPGSEKLTNMLDYQHGLPISLTVILYSLVKLLLFFFYFAYNVSQPLEKIVNHNIARPP